ncbi:hypothetical protein BGZ76_000229 [Entomortierella beljakovae]|nr:hypothetical protein BGZ76_000229 [Entomortierella beljakovae]
MTSSSNSQPSAEPFNLSAPPPQVYVIEDSSESDSESKINQSSDNSNQKSPDVDINKRKKQDVEVHHQFKVSDFPLNNCKKPKLDFNKPKLDLNKPKLGFNKPQSPSTYQKNPIEADVITISSDEDDGPPPSISHLVTNPTLALAHRAWKDPKTEPHSPSKNKTQSRPNKPRRLHNSKSFQMSKDVKEDTLSKSDGQEELKGNDNLADDTEPGVDDSFLHGSRNKIINPEEIDEFIPDLTSKDSDVDQPKSSAIEVYKLPDSLLISNDSNIHPLISDYMSISSDEASDYEADHLHGGLLEIPRATKNKSLRDIDFVELMNRSYHDSRCRPLTYQSDIERQYKGRTLISGSYRRPTIQQPTGFTTREMEVIFSCVAEATKILKPIDWESVAKEVYNSTGRAELPDPDKCLWAFEYAIAQYKVAPKESMSAPITLHSKVSLVNALRRREYGRDPRHIIKDSLLLKQSRNYRCATTFNYASGSVVDMAFKTSSSKLAIANVATQDIYNRPGNLLLCDLGNGITKQLNGHERLGQTADQKLAVTVNDIKLSYSKNFFISGADDHKTMIWDSETGQHLHTIEDCPSRVNRIAVLEDSQNGQDVFATCSDSGLLNMYALNSEGEVGAKNKQLNAGNRNNKNRSISSISFGYGFFWDCLVAGLEGYDNGLNNDGLQGQIAFFDANTLARVAVGDLGFRQVTSLPTARSVSCVSFSSTGNFVVCGTSGRTNAGDDEQGDGFLRVFDVRSAKEIEIAYSGHADVNLAEFSPCETYIISGSNSNEVAVFDRRFLGSEPLHRLCHQKWDDDANAGITSALWWPTGLGSSQTMLISGGGDGAVKLWDIRRASEDTEIWSFDAKLGPIARMVSSDFFESLVVGGDTGAVSVFTISNRIVSQYEEKPMSLFSQGVDE